MQAESEYDVLIVGGGLVGASLAIALERAPLRVALVEAVPFRSERQPSYDDRVIALAYGTRRVFEGMGVWPELAPQVTPIRAIHISDRGHFGFTHLHAEDEGVEALGYVAESRVLGRVLSERLAALDNVEVVCPARVASVAIGSRHVEVAVSMGVDANQNSATANRENRVFNGRLVIAADGAKSMVRDLVGIHTTQWDYGQTAIIANVTPERAHANRAYERFTDSGPLALLPMSDNRCSLVWTVRHHKVDEIMALDDATFLALLQERFGQRLGAFQRVGARHAYPLSLVRAREHVRERLALIGNAAHTLHPVAGQGFNLGLRDVAALAQVLVDGVRGGRDVGELQVLQEYARWRRRDHLKVITFTDGLARVFANPLAPVRMLRNFGLLAVDTLPPIKHVLTRHTMGLAGKLPRLARGLPL